MAVKITIQNRTSIPADSIELLYRTMATCPNSQRLLVCLFFLADKSQRHLSTIETELRRIFPPSLPYGFTPDKYSEFQASAIRQYFNFENMALTNGTISDNDRLWTSSSRGYWENTALGNERALAILARRNVFVEMSGTSFKPPQGTYTPLITALKKEEELAEQAIAKLQTQTAIDLPFHPEDIEKQINNIDIQRTDEELLVLPWISTLLSEIANLKQSASCIEEDGGSVTTIIEGNPVAVRQAIESMSDRLEHGEIELNLKFNSDGCSVRLTARLSLLK